MYFGNEIKLSSDRLTYNLFESNWYEQSLVRKKYLLMMMQFFVKPQELIIGKVFPLTLETFVSVSFFGIHSMFSPNFGYYYIADNKLRLHSLQRFEKYEIRMTSLIIG